MPEKQTIIGVDPGYSGALVVLEIGAYSTPRIAEIIDMPLVKVRKKNEINIPALSNLIQKQNIFRPHPVTAWVERVHAMPKQGVSSMFRFGQAYGIILGLLWAHQIPVTLVTPQEWKKTFKMSGTGKDTSRMLASQYFSDYTGAFKRKMDAGRSDAALIALHGFRTMP